MLQVRQAVHFNVIVHSILHVMLCVIRSTGLVSRTVHNEAKAHVGVAVTAPVFLNLLLRVNASLL
jgi:hypothetical protein